ncbi:MAG: thioredoxin family protein [Patescibacteria group bacterium]|nr:thioredoxin family protein [Patescibacteria group bacterium]
MNIKILGSGCPNCQTLENQAKQAVKELALQDTAIEHIYDITQITQYGLMSIPAIVINEEVKAAGRIPSVEEIKNWLK